MYKEKKYRDFVETANFVSEPLELFNYSRNSDVNQLSMLSLFSGCGGMDLGFEGGFLCHKKSIPTQKQWIEQTISKDWVLLKKNRFNTIFANDILQEAALSWVSYMQRMGKDSSIFHTDSIVDLVKAHLSGAEIFPKKVDIVVGGFPCQDFSVAGKRKGFGSDKAHDGKVCDINIPSEETRGKLYYWMKQVIDITQPKIFVAENVKGLVSLGDVRTIIQKDFASAANSGYIVLMPKVLHAGNYGVPETRERVIFIGLKRESLKPDIRKILDSGDIPPEYDPYPQPTHDFNVNDSKLSKPVICKDVLADLVEPEYSFDLSQRFYSKAKYMGKHCQGQSEININGLAPTIRSEHHGNIEFRRLSTEHGGENMEELNAGLKERRLTPRECALIQTFPPDYPFVRYKKGTNKFAVSQSGAYKVIGNAVPPILAYNIAKRLEELWSIYFD